MLINSDGKFLTRDEILELSKTEKGRKVIFDYIVRARSAMAAQRVMERLDVVPDEQTQQDICLIIFHTCFSVPIESVMEYVQSIAEHQPEKIYEC